MTDREAPVAGCPRCKTISDIKVEHNRRGAFTRCPKCHLEIRLIREVQPIPQIAMISVVKREKVKPLTLRQMHKRIARRG